MKQLYTLKNLIHTCTMKLDSHIIDLSRWSSGPARIGRFQKDFLQRALQKICQTIERECMLADAIKQEPYLLRWYKVCLKVFPTQLDNFSEVM